MVNIKLLEKNNLDWNIKIIETGKKFFNSKKSF